MDMKKYLTTTAVSLALAASPALADNETDINQILDGVQTALNALYAEDGGSNVEQVATNAGNIISRGADSLDDISQVIGDDDPMTQLARNIVESEDFNISPANEDGWEDVMQSATNVLNSLSMESGASLETLYQSANASAQDAINRLRYDGDTVDVNQAAVNAANLFNASETSVGNNVSGPELQQGFTYGDQFALSFATGESEDDMDDIVQGATNVVNSISVASLDDASQYVYDGDQTARNTLIMRDDLRFIDGVDIGDGEMSEANTQDAINAANLLNFTGGADDLYQSSRYADQIARNLIDGASSGDDIEDVIQTATNVTNSVSGDVDASGTFLDQVTQRAYGLEQAARNFIDMGDELFDTTQNATNAANIATFRDLIEGHYGGAHQDWDGWGFGNQIATNAVDDGSRYGAVADLTQAATNVINSLSGDDINTDGRYGLDIAVYQRVDMRGHDSYQLARNFVSFGRDYGTTNGLTNLDQDATNAANMVTLGQVDGNVGDLRGVTRQMAYMDQTALNRAVPNNDYRAGNISILDQSAVNATNVISADTLPNLAGVDDIVQSATGSQFSSNLASTFSMAMDVTQAATNVANSVGMPSGDDG